MPCSQKNAKKHAIVEMWLALAATNKKAGAYNSTSKLIYELLKQLSDELQGETFAASLFQNLLEATPDQYEIYNTHLHH